MNKFAGMITAVLCFAPGLALSDEAVVNVSSQDVQSANNQITIHVALPEEVIGKRLDRITFEVPITVGASEDSAFVQFPMVELLQSGSEEAKQTTLLPAGFDGTAHFDVTRFVLSWSTTDDHEFVLGALSEANQTVLELGSAGEWGEGVKARLVVRFSSLAGASATTIGAR